MIHLLGNRDIKGIPVEGQIIKTVFFKPSNKFLSELSIFSGNEVFHGDTSIGKIIVSVLKERMLFVFFGEYGILCRPGYVDIGIIP